MELRRGERVNGTAKTILLGVVIVAWGSVHLAGLIEHVSVSGGFDTTFAALVGVVSAVKTKKDKTKD
jgi:hypothetical protein